MTATFANAKRAFAVSSNALEPCKVCGARFDRVTDGINHYIAEHECWLLHVGTETTRDESGAPWQSTVAYLATYRGE